MPLHPEDSADAPILAQLQEAMGGFFAETLARDASRARAILAGVAVADI